MGAGASIGTASEVSQRYLFELLQQHHKEYIDLVNAEVDDGDDRSADSSCDSNGSSERENRYSKYEKMNFKATQRLFIETQRAYSSWLRSVRLHEKAIFAPLTNLEWALSQAFNSGLTPLLLDSSSDDKVCTFFSYQPDVVIFEAKLLVVHDAQRQQKRQQGSNKKREELSTAVLLPVAQHLEAARRALVNAMKFGKLLVIRIGTTAPDFVHRFNDSVLPFDTTGRSTAFFPLEVFYRAGLLLKGNGWPERLFRDEDMKPHKNFAFCRDSFRVCIASQMPLEDIEEFLFGESGSEVDAVLEAVDLQQLAKDVSTVPLSPRSAAATDLQQRAAMAAEMVLALESESHVAEIDNTFHRISGAASEEGNDRHLSCEPAASAKTVTSIDAALLPFNADYSTADFDKSEQDGLFDINGAAELEECMPPLNISSYRGMLPPTSYFKVICIAPEEEQNDDQNDSEADDHDDDRERATAVAEDSSSTPNVKQRHTHRDGPWR